MVENKLLLSLPDFADMTSLSVAMVRKLIRQDRIRTVKAGDRRLISMQAARDFVANLESDAQADRTHRASS